MRARPEETERDERTSPTDRATGIGAARAADVRVPTDGRGRPEAFIPSHLVLAALRVLHPAEGRDYWRDLAAVASVLREAHDPEVEAPLAPMRDREAWGRLIELSDNSGSAVSSRDLKTEYQNPDAHAALWAGLAGESDDEAA